MNDVEQFVNTGEAGKSIVLLILSLSDVGYSAGQIGELIVGVASGVREVDFDNWYIKDCSQDACQPIQPERMPAGVFADLSGTWLDFNFSDIDSGYYYYHLKIKDFLDYSDPDKFHGSGGGPATIQKIEDLLEDKYKVSFGREISQFDGTTAYFENDGDIYRYGSWIYVQTETQTIQQNGDVVAYQALFSNCRLRKLPPKAMNHVFSIPQKARMPVIPCLLYWLGEEATAIFFV